MSRPADDEDVTGPIEAQRPPNEVAISADIGALPSVAVNLDNEGDGLDSLLWRFVLRGCKHLCRWMSKQCNQLRGWGSVRSKGSSEGVGQPTNSGSADDEPGPDTPAHPRS